jgi:hypothetical protein
MGKFENNWSGVKHYLMDTFNFSDNKAESLMIQYPEYMDSDDNQYEIAETLNEQFEQEDNNQ